jgi:hypothetical protein
MQIHQETSSVGNTRKRKKRTCRSFVGMRFVWKSPCLFWHPLRRLWWMILLPKNIKINTFPDIVTKRFHWLDLAPYRVPFSLHVGGSGSIPSAIPLFSLDSGTLFASVCQRGRVGGGGGGESFRLHLFTLSNISASTAQSCLQLGYIYIYIYI